jgi:hypothetical protein
VAEDGRRVQQVAAARGVGVLDAQRVGQHHRDGAVGGVDAEGVVPERRARLPVRGQEHPPRRPLLTPPLQLGLPVGCGQRLFGGGAVVEVVAGVEQPASAPGDPHPAALPLPHRPAQLALQDLQPLLLRPPLAVIGIPTHPPAPLSHPAARCDGEAGGERGDRAAQRTDAGVQRPPGQLVLVLAGAGDRSRPAGGRLRGQCLLPLGPPIVRGGHVPDPHPRRQVRPGQRAQVLPDRPQYLLIGG